MRVSKIDSGQSSVQNVKKKPDTPNSTFSNLMQDKKDDQKREELNQMLGEIKDKGEKLVDSRNLELLIEYKKSVKEFVNTAVEFAFEIIDKKGHSRIGRTKILKIVSQIDDELVKLTDEFIAEERNRLNLLAKIGELGGLLTNIYI